MKNLHRTTGLMSLGIFCWVASLAQGQVPFRPLYEAPANAVEAQHLNALWSQARAAATRRFVGLLHAYLSLSRVLSISTLVGAFDVCVDAMVLGQDRDLYDLQVQRNASRAILQTIDFPQYSTAAAAEPRDYSGSLGRELRQRLNPEEFLLIQNPLASTPEMDRWATQLVVGATSNLEKARIIHDTLAIRVSPKPIATRRYRTAKEVYANWGVSGNYFLCQELGYLFIALARAVGIKAYGVFVEEDCYGGIWKICEVIFEK